MKKDMAGDRGEQRGENDEAVNPSPFPNQTRLFLYFCKVFWSHMSIHAPGGSQKESERERESISFCDADLLSPPSSIHTHTHTHLLYCGPEQLRTMPPFSSSVSKWRGTTECSTAFGAGWRHEEGY